MLDVYTHFQFKMAQKYTTWGDTYLHSYSCLIQGLHCSYMYLVEEGESTWGGGGGLPVTLVTCLYYFSFSLSTVPKVNGKIFVG